APQRPLSAAMMTRCKDPVAGRDYSRGWPLGPLLAMSLITEAILLAKGRAATMRSWERRRRAAATIFMALVICWMFFADLMRTRSSFSDAILLEGQLEFVDRLIQVPG